jgi:tRNA pseudouridine32 synthase/23S rRNA pseudouridine746 synthase
LSEAHEAAGSFPGRLTLDDAYAPPTEPWLDILYHDKDIVVLNKPAGLLSTPGRDPARQDSALLRVRAQFGWAELVHRLDAATSGILVLALRRKAEIDLKRQFHERLTQKRYRARVLGRVERDEGEIDLPLFPDFDHKPLQKVCTVHGKPSITRFQVLQRSATTSLLELIPITGRSHQLRVHLMAIGHPILGDRFYGVNSGANALADRLLLHAESLTFQHPYDGREMLFKAEANVDSGF